MKRILTILMIVVMVFSVTGCDPEARANLAHFMGGMGHNVLGSDTSAAENVGETAKVDTSKIKPADDIKKDVDSNGDTPVEIAPSLNVTVPKEEIHKVESVLPPMETAQKEEVLDQIGSALQNTESTDKLIETMKQPYGDKEVEKAAQGTATVMKSALKQVAEQLPEEVPQEVKNTIGDLGKSLEKISENPEGITKADVVTLQLVQSFVETVNEKKDDIKPGSVPPEVLSDANNLLTVATALSEASKFDPLSVDFSALLPQSATVADSGSKAIVPRDAASDAVTDALKTLNDIEIEPDKQKYANVAYGIIDSVIGHGKFAATKSGLAFHKMSYENYANMAATNLNLSITSEGEKSVIKYNEDSPYLTSLTFKEFRTFSGFMQYVVAAVLSEGDDFYQAYKVELGKLWETYQNDWADAYVKAHENDEDPTGVKTKDEYLADITAALKVVPADIKDLFYIVVKENDWVTKPTDKIQHITIPEKYYALKDLPVDVLGDLAAALMTGKNAEGKVVTGAKQYFRTTLETLNKMVVFTDLSKLGNFSKDLDINYELTSLIEKFYMDPKPAKPEGTV